MNALMPDGSRCFFFSRSVHAKTRKLSATSASEIHDLLAGQHVPVALLHRDRLDAARVAAGARLGQAVAGDLLALRLRHEIPLLLIFGAPREQRQAVEAGVHRHDHAQRRVDVLELLARQPERDVVHAGAAVLAAAPRRRAARARPSRRACARGRSGARRSCSRMFGATSRAAHSRTDCSSSRCSSVRSKLDHTAGNRYHAGRRTRTGAPRPSPSAAAALAAVHRHLEMARAAEERAQLARPARRRRSTTTPRDLAAADLARPRPPAGATASTAARSMFVIRLPKRSTRTTSPVMPSAPTIGAAAARARTGAAGGGRARPDRSPRASQAAAGAKRSRPSNVVPAAPSAAPVARLGQRHHARGRRLVEARPTARRCPGRRSGSRRPRPRGPRRADPDARIDDDEEDRAAAGKYR